jgi:lantibiotic modifying enzyme
MISLKHYVHPIVDEIITSGIEGAENSSSALMWSWHGKQYLAAAHGVAGIIYILLDLDYVKNYPKYMQLITCTMDWMCTLLTKKHGNFPSREGGSDQLVQWCHGAPGIIPTLVKMYKLTNKSHYLQVAEAASEVVWQKGLLRKGFGICHGVAGNAYMFMYLYEVTKKQDYLIKLLAFTRYITDKNNQAEYIDKPDHPYSLFEGITPCIINES